jgi:hypothetical protein
VSGGSGSARSSGELSDRDRANQVWLGHGSDGPRPRSSARACPALRRLAAEPGVPPLADHRLRLGHDRARRDDRPQREDRHGDLRGDPLRPGRPRPVGHRAPERPRGLPADLLLRLAVWQETVGAAEAQEWAVVVPSTGIVQNAPRSSPSGRIIDRPAGRIRSARSGGARPTSGATRQWLGARFTPSRHFCHTRVRTPAWAVGARVLDAPVVGCDLRVADRAPVAPFRRVGA